MPCPQSSSVTQHVAGSMADEEIFELYRQCLAVVQEAGAPVPDADPDHSKLALALLHIIRGEKPAKQQPKAKTRRHKRST
jgi:hypothetical protein